MLRSTEERTDRANERTGERATASGLRGNAEMHSNAIGIVKLGDANGTSRVARSQTKWRQVWGIKRDCLALDGDGFSRGNFSPSDSSLLSARLINAAYVMPLLRCAIDVISLNVRCEGHKS